MKTLFVVTDDWYFLSHRLDLARALYSRGVEVVVVTGPGGRHAEIVAEGFEHRVLPFQRTVWSQPLNSILLLRLVALYRREAPDLIHHVSFFPVFFGSIAAKFSSGAGVVNAITGLGHAFSGQSLKQRLLRFFLEPAYRFVLKAKGTVALFQNRDDKEHFIDRGLVAEEMCVEAPGAGVDLNKFAIGSEDPPPIIVHASRMLWTKGVGDTVQASLELKARGIEHELVLAGRTHPANPESIPEQQLSDWQEDGILRYYGHHNDIADLYAGSAVVCMPSRYREGIPLALIEAASCGRPIVTTDIPGCREVVSHEETGFLVKPASPLQIADALERLLTDRDLWRSMSSASRERARNRFSRELVLERTFSAYRLALKPHCSASDVDSFFRANV